MTDGTADVRLTNNVLMNNTELSPDITSADYIISSTGVRYKLRTEKVTSGYYSGLHLIANYYKLADAIASTATSSTYLLQPDSAKTYESADKNLGSLRGASLIVDGGSETKYGINGANYSGVSVANGKTLTIQNVGSTSGSTITDSITGFESVNGGFVNNDGTLVLSNTVFSANSATTNGGAVYNGTNGTITLNGTNTFANNSANSVPNDIYNLGTITLASSSTTNINSGISGYHGLINMGSGAVLNVNGAVDNNTISLSNSAINIGSGKLYLEGLTNDANGGTIDSRNNRIDYNNGVTDYTNYLG
jgi:predicted outer membrane repeat protein